MTGVLPPTPSFFVPNVALDKHEEAYAALAKAAGRAPLPLGERIFSISFRHDSEDWVATVGRRLRGTKVRSTRSRGQRIERTIPLSNPSVVLAILPGVPFLVWHDDTSRVWVNPFLAGEPRSITRFAP